MTMTTPPSLPTDPYREIAELYDLEHNEFDGDIDILTSFAQAVGDPILEVGCGSGRIVLPLAEAGFHVTGIDTSRPMLDRAGRRVAEHGLGDRVHLVEADMRTMNEVPGGPFGLVIFSLNSLMHLANPADQRAALMAAHQALDPKGQLIIDLMNPTPEQITHLYNGPHLEGSWTLADGSTVDKWSHRKASDEPQVMDTLLWYDRTSPDGHLTRIRTAFPLRYIHASELALMLELTGFVDPVFYGSYDLDPFEPEADRLLVTAEVQPARHRD
ncbi:MAG TPA: class I SAM-dependent methyltransferase [Thermomicrobiales bacterium]|nr:class I SAM-dependent methyltransferase [Thermomicrobiales bacterium]